MRRVIWFLRSYRNIFVLLNSAVLLVIFCFGVTQPALAMAVHTDTASSLFYSLLLNPNSVFLLFVVAMLGIFVEISHPGAIFPGVVGAIALVLFLVAASFLAPNWGGFALMLLAAVLLVLDVKLPAHGVLTLGAVVSLVVGTLLFFNTNGPQIQPIVVYITGAVVGIIGLALVALAIRVKRKKVTTGIEGMVGSRVTAVTPLHPKGRVRYEGENWAAIMDMPDASADPGSQLQIVAVEGLRLRVRTYRPLLMVQSHVSGQNAPKE